MIRKLILSLCLGAILTCLPAFQADAVEYYWGSHPDHERIVFEFQGQVQNFDAIRTEAQEISLHLPDNIWERETRPGARNITGSRLLSQVRIEGSSFVIDTNTNAFGFISFALPQENKIVIDIFRDPLGAQWDVAPAAPEQRPLPADEHAEPDQPEPVSQLDIESVPAQVTHRMRSQIQRNGFQDHNIAQSPVVQPSSRVTGRIEGRTVQQEPVEQVDIEEVDPLLVHEEQEEQDEVVYEDIMPRTDPEQPFEDMLFAARVMMSGGDHRGAVNILNQLIDDPDLPEGMLEDLLYTYANANFQRFRHDIRNNFIEIISPFERAINFDPGSDRLPEALLSLGYIHLHVGNEPEAQGYFNLLRNRFPRHESVPATFFYQGEFYSRNNRFQEAADSFNHIVQEFPEDQLVRPAAVNLARVLSELDYHRQALDILEFIESRWPRNHVDDPDSLILAGYIFYQNDRLDQARERFLHYINLLPEGDQVAVSMARIGDIYLLQGKREAARAMHEQTVRMFPDEEGGLIAAMRLAEEGIYDDPEISDFDRPFSMRPRAIYRRISEEFPDSPLAPVALLKLAMWDIFHGYFNYQESLDAIERFYERYTHKELWPRALEVGFEAFSAVVAQEFPRENFQEIIDTWEKYRYLHNHPEHLSDEARIALATAYWNKDRIEEALIMSRPFLDQPDISEENYAAMSLLLAIYLDTADWQAILDLEESVNDWELPRDERLQMDYAHALALQNLGREDEALPIWRRLAVERDFPGKQRAFALFFLASDAFERQDHQNVYIFAQEALAMFMDQEERNVQRIRSCLDMLMHATSSTGRVREALGWALEYENYIDRDDPDWPAFQFRLARMYRLNNQFDNWERILRRLIRDFPDDMFSRMARSELNTRRLLEDAQQFRP